MSELRETMYPVILDRGLPCVEQGCKLTLTLGDPDAAPEDIPNEYVLLADQGRPDHLTWQLGNADSMVVEPNQIVAPDGRTANGFIVGACVAIVPISYNGQPLSERLYYEIDPGKIVQKITAEKDGAWAIYSNSGLDDEVVNAAPENVCRYNFNSDMAYRMTERPDLEA